MKNENEIKTVGTLLAETPPPPEEIHDPERQASDSQNRPGRMGAATIPGIDSGIAAARVRKGLKKESDYVIDYCKGLRVTSMTPKRLVQVIKSVHANGQELGERYQAAKDHMLFGAIGNRAYAWAAGCLLKELKGKKIGDFRDYARAETGLSNATISRYLKLEAYYSDLDDLLETTVSLSDAYGQCGAIRPKSVAKPAEDESEGGVADDAEPGDVSDGAPDDFVDEDHHTAAGTKREARTAPDRCEELSASVSQLQKKLRLVVASGTGLNEQLRNQLALIVSELQNLLKMPTNSEPAAAA